MPEDGRLRRWTTRLGGDEPRVRILIFAVVALVALATGAYRLHHDRGKWPPDTQIYLRMTLEDRGLSRPAALAEANRIMLKYAIPSVRGDTRFTSHPPGYFARQFPLFRNRPLYPRLAATLYPLGGARTLQYIPAISYVLAVLAMFGLLLLYAPPWLAGIGAVALAMAPAVLGVEAVGSTDEPALLLWIVTLGLMLIYLRRPSSRLLAAVGVAALVLTFTRPAIYLPVGAALGALVAFRRDVQARAAALRLLAVTAAVGVVFLVGSALLHGPGVAGQLRWVYDWQHQTGATSHAFAGWYAHALGSIVGQALSYDIYKNGALLTIVLAVVGLVVARRTAAVPVAVGAILASAVGLFVNPVEFVRTVELPLTPVIVLLAICGLATLVRREPAAAPAVAAPAV